MFHSLVPHELLPQRMESLFIRDEVYMSECRFNTSTFLPATQIQGLRNVSKSLPFFPHCKSCLSYMIVSEMSKEWKTLNTSNKTFMDSLSSCKGKATHGIGAPCTSPFCCQWCGIWCFALKVCTNTAGKALVCFGAVKRSVICLVGFSSTFWMCSTVDSICRRMTWMSQ